jgi:hypothetical protein
MRVEFGEFNVRVQAGIKATVSVHVVSCSVNLANKRERENYESVLCRATVKVLHTNYNNKYAN